MRFKSILLAALLAVVASSLFYSRATEPPWRRTRIKHAVNPAVLSAADVAAVVASAASAVNAETMVIAVTDRQGDILGVYRKPAAPVTTAGNFSIQQDSNEVAVSLARTTSFFSNDTAPLSSRTVRFISGIHFPPGIPFTSNAPLYGIENTNRGCPFNADYIPGQAFPPARSIDNSKPGLGIMTGKADLYDSDPNAVNPGGIPLYKNGIIVGGVGVTGVPPNVAEYAALIGSVGAGFGPTPVAPGQVVIGGLAVPFVSQKTLPAGYSAGSADGTFVFGPLDSPGPDPQNDLVAPRAGKVGGLTQEDVQQIVNNAVAEGNQTRAVIRLPLGTKARFVISVSDLDGTLLAIHRMPDATIFSIDVSVSKSRNVIFFSGPNRLTSDLPGVPMGTAVTNRTISFGAQPLYAPGIDYSSPGPFFNLYKFDTLNPCTQGSQPANINQNGIVFFPGSLPLYKNGMLVGGLGVSGDGVDQDDFVTNAGAAGFYAPSGITADHIIDQGVRLPYIKFPRNPTD